MARPQRQRHRSARTSGVALIAVLWLVSLLTVLAVGVLESVRRHGHLAQRSFESVQLRELADSAIRITLLELSTPSPDAAAAVTLGNQSMEIFGTSIALDIEAEGGRIDLNSAERDLLSAAFAANGFAEEEAATLADRIIDWRDPDDAPSPQGAERPEYQRGGRRDGPRNGPFEAISEVRRVLGVENISDELLDAFTVYSHGASVRETSAPASVMRALHWADERQLGAHRWLSEQPAQLTATGPVTLMGQAVRLTACTSISERRLCRRAVIRLTGNAQRPAQVFLWDSFAG